MDESGITMQVLNTRYPVYSGQADAAATLAAIRKINDSTAAWSENTPAALPHLPRCLYGTQKPQPES